MQIRFRQIRYQLLYNRNRKDVNAYTLVSPVDDPWSTHFRCPGGKYQLLLYSEGLGFT